MKRSNPSPNPPKAIPKSSKKHFPDLKQEQRAFLSQPSVAPNPPFGERIRHFVENITKKRLIMATFADANRIVYK